MGYNGGENRNHSEALMKNERTMMYMLTETSPFMMSFVIITKEDNAIVVDGGRPDDVPLLLEYIGKRKVKGWFLTHPHDDHVTALSHILHNTPDAVDIERIYYHFPPYGFVAKYEHFEAKTLAEFFDLEVTFKNKFYVCKPNEHIEIDELSFDILFTFSPYLKSNAVNDASMVFRVNGEKKSVLFLGDIGPEAGDELLRLQQGNLRADYVQMAHHGHMCCDASVYMEIEPEACFWCAPEWLYNEEPKYIRERMYGEKMTRKWMEKMGVTQHYVTKDGTQSVEI